VNHTCRATKSSRRAAPASQALEPRRKLVVFASLVAVLMVTSALLRALAPAPLMPGGATSLFAVEASPALDAVFDTGKPVQAGRWQYVYVHHSRTASGNAQLLADASGNLADHFVIGNGDGCADGELQVGQRWSRQQAAAATPGLRAIQPNSISVCLVGDFNHTRPTAAQMRRLTQLVETLQGRLGLSADHVWTLEANGSPAGVGHLFPKSEFRHQLLP
jgi:hypothetical protein